MRASLITKATLTIALMAAGAAATTAFAQQSASYRLSEQIFDAGGHPGAGGVLASASYRVLMDAIGGTFSDHVLTGPSLRLAGDFISAYPPPGPVPGLRFSATDTLDWDPERSAGVYNVYRGALSAFQLAVDTSTCFLSGLSSRSTGPLQSPAPGSAYYYLVSAKNLLAEEGPSRIDTSGAPHDPPNPCPGP